MRITYLGHAGFIVETDQTIVVMDPWLSPGEFDFGWFQYPRNHHLASVVKEKLRTSKDRYICLSHDHKDHYDIKFLESLKDLGLSFLIPEFEISKFKLSSLGKVIELKHKEIFSFKDSSLQLFITQSGVDRDSAILFRTPSESFLNVNDAKIGDTFEEIGHVDIFTGQYSGATWHPVCYQYEDPVRIAEKKISNKFESIKEAIQVLSAKVYIPSAGPPCFLDPDLFELNFHAFFPRSEAIQEFLQKVFVQVSVRVPLMNPGDSFSTDSLEELDEMNEFFSVDQIKDDIIDYRREQSANLQLLETYKQIDPEGIESVWENLKTELRAKLDQLNLRKEISTSLFFGLKELPNRWIKVDFLRNQISEVPSMMKPYYKISAPAWQIGRVLKRLLSWEDFIPTFRMKLDRNPDQFNEILLAFLMLEIEDISWFCETIENLRNSETRIKVKANNKVYEMNRFCPHQGADLKGAQITEEGFVICPRHRWQFDLNKGGRCLDQIGSIEATCEIENKTDK